MKKMKSKTKEKKRKMSVRKVTEGKEESDWENIRMEIAYLRFKNRMLSELLKIYSPINIDTLIDQNDSDIYVNDYKGSTINIIIKNITEKSEKEKKKKHRYRTIRDNEIEYIFEDSMGSCAEKDYEEIKFDHNVSVSPTREKKILASIKKNKEKLRQASERGKNSLLSILSKNLENLLKIYSYDKYEEFLKNHVSELEEIFSAKKGKRLEKIISSSLNSIDTRILLYGSYYKIVIGRDDCETFHSLLLKMIDHRGSRKPFDKSKTFSYFNNYAIALFPLKELLKLILIGPEEKNLVYFPFKKSSKEDPYSFYSLKSIDKDINMWMMESRMEDFAYDLAESIKKYSISLFRKIYYDFFNDNDYRENYTNRCNIFQQDCLQLLHNLYLVCRENSFRREIQDIIMVYATVVPTKNDKCNITRNDKLQEKTLKGKSDDMDNAILVSRELFDDISIKQSLEFWKSMAVE